MNSRKLDITCPSEGAFRRLSEGYYIEVSSFTNGVDIYREKNGKFERIIGSKNQLNSFGLNFFFILDREQNIPMRCRSDSPGALIEVEETGVQNVVVGDIANSFNLIFYLKNNHQFDKYYLIDTSMADSKGAPRKFEVDLKERSIKRMNEKHSFYDGILEHCVLGYIFPDGTKPSKAFSEVSPKWCMKYGTKYFVSAFIPINFDIYEGRPNFFRLDIYDSTGKIYRHICVELDHSLTEARVVAIYGRFVYVHFGCEVCIRRRLFTRRAIFLYCFDMINALPKETYYYWDQPKGFQENPAPFQELIGERSYQTRFVQAGSDILLDETKPKIIEYFDFRKGSLKELPRVVKREAMALLLCWKFGDAGLGILIHDIMFCIMYFLI